ncbi:MAG: hypothetical protein FWG10_01570 [Eubacteriaceae bacterium]|nr:hypothetical protein [Eubacteriaceae bacterium]
MDNEANSLTCIHHINLKDSREIKLDENELSISIFFAEKQLFCFPVPYPTAGYGGGSLYLSPSNLYLLFLYYSGQSEEAFILFSVNDKLDIIYKSGYLLGEGASYTFSKDEKLLVQGLPDICSSYEEYDIEDFIAKDKNGRSYITFGHVNIVDIEKKGMSSHVIHVYSKGDWCFLNKEFDFMSPKMTSSNELSLSLPWGDEILVLPLAEKIIFAPG